MDSSVHRLSRVREQYKANKAVKDESHESFVLTYYQQKPEEMDTRSPDEKLSEIRESLQNDDLPQEERHRLLSQQKQLCYFAHGEDSPEMMRCEKDLGLYYNRNHRPASAVRHLTAARNLEQKNNVEPEERMEIAVEIAEACLALRDVNKRQETMKKMTLANDALQPVMDTEVENLQLMYRRDLAQARITTTRGRFEQALEQYNKALEGLEKIHGHDHAEVANLYVEMADVAEADENEELAGKHYKSAYDIYVKLDMTEEANTIEPKIPVEQKVEEEEEEEVMEHHSESQHSLQEAPVERQIQSSGSEGGIKPGSDVQPPETVEDKENEKSESSDSEKDAKSEHSDVKPASEGNEEEKTKSEHSKSESDTGKNESGSSVEKQNKKSESNEYYSSYATENDDKKPQKSGSDGGSSSHASKKEKNQSSEHEYYSESEKKPDAGDAE